MAAMLRLQWWYFACPELFSKALDLDLSGPDPRSTLNGVNSMVLVLDATKFLASSDQDGSHFSLLNSLENEPVSW